MRKSASLRVFLAAAIPELARHPDRLAIYVEAGSLRARQSNTLSYALSYTLKVGVWGFTGDANALFVPVLAWIAREEPTLLRRADSTPFGFEADLLDSKTSDLLLSLDLTEAVVVTPDSAGGVRVETPPEPDFTNDAFADTSSPLIEILANLDLSASGGTPTDGG